jgi:hypothetical protein
MSGLDEVIARLEFLNEEERVLLLRHLRTLVAPHPMEERLKANAETLLEAIGRASPLTIRGIEGILAEASFAMEVLPTLGGWQALTPPSDAAFDFLLDDGSAAERIRLQVKMQRRRNHLPWMANEAMKSTRSWPADFYVVEVQRTRGGETPEGTGTRPYRFGEFDLLAVSLGAAKGHWHDFIYTVANWLIPEPGNETQILNYQPVSPVSNDDWTTDFNQAVTWHRSGQKKTISG